MIKPIYIIQDKLHLLYNTLFPEHKPYSMHSHDVQGDIAVLPPERRNRPIPHSHYAQALP